MRYGDTVKRWEVELDGTAHRFRMEHNFWTGEKRYFVDDELLEQVSGGLLASAAFHKDVPFSVGAHQGRFRHRAVGRVAFYDLLIDDAVIEGEETRAWRMPPWFAVILLILLGVVAFVAMGR